MSFGFIFPLRQLHWWLGLAILVLGGIVFALVYLERRRRARLELFVDARLAPRLLLGYDGSVRRPLFWLPVIGFAGLALAFAQPHWGQAWQKVRQQSHDIVVCLDVSASMNAANPLPTRLDRAKQKVFSILDRTPGDRFGVIAFAGMPAMQAPLTHDQGYLKSVLSTVDTDTVSQEGTDIAAAIRDAVKVFKDEGQITGVVDNNSRAILVISDGEQVSGDAVAEAEKAAAFARVFVIGVGDPNGTEIRLTGVHAQAHQGDRGEKAHLSKLDEETLKKLALSGKGAYIRSTPDNTDIDQIYENIVKLTAYASSSDIRFQLVNRYQWPLAIAFLCFAAEGAWIALMPWVRSVRMRRGPASRGGRGRWRNEQVPVGRGCVRGVERGGMGGAVVQRAAGEGPRAVAGRGRGGRAETVP